MNRRTFTAVVATLPVAGCTYFDDDQAVVEVHLDAEDDPVRFETVEGDRFDVTVEAGDEGAEVVIASSMELDERSRDEAMPDAAWQFDPGEERVEAFEAYMNGEWDVWVADGSAHIEIDLDQE